MGKNIVAVIAGIVVAVLVVMGIQWLGHVVYPMPEGLDINDADAMSEHIAGLPLGAFMFVLASYALGALAGGLLASKLAASSRMLMAGIVIGLILVATLVTLVQIAHPLWFSMAAVGVVVLVFVLVRAMVGGPER